MRQTAATQALNVSTPISMVMPEQITSIMDKIIPLLRKVVKPQTGYIIEDVLRDLLNGHTALWIIGDFQALTITRVQERSTGRVLWNEWLAGDNMDEWVADWMTIQEAYARHAECTAIEFAGRKAYNRKYQPIFNQFRAIRTIYRQDLTQ